MSKKGTKIVETKIGESKITPKILPTNQSKNFFEISERPVVPVPEVKLSPLRTRLQERNKSVPVSKEPHPLTQKKTTPVEKEKPKKKVVVDVKSPPKVFKSPRWYKSPERVKPIAPQQAQRDAFRLVLIQAGCYTEQEIEKLMEDYK